MSTRPPAAGGQSARAASAANRLSQVLAAGLEQKLSLGICAPCNRAGQLVQRRAAATDRIVENDEDVDWSRVTGPRYPNGPRFAKTCPEDDDPRQDCDEEDKVNTDPISLEEFGIGKPIMVLGCGHCFNPDTLARWVRGKKSRKCVYDDNYDMTNKELEEIGFTPEEMGEILPGNFTRLQLEDRVLIYRNDERGQVLVRAEFPEGVRFFEGSSGEERMVRSEYASGEVLFYEGPLGEERMLRMEYADGHVQFYEGPRDEERHVRSEWPNRANGEVQFYEGPRDEERLVSIKFANGEVQFHEGPMDEERLVRSEFADREVQFHEGPRDEERLVRSEFADGHVSFFEGPQGEEHLVRLVT